MLRKLYSWMYRFSKKRLGIKEEDWTNVKVVGTDTLQAITFTSTHQLDNIERTILFADEIGLGPMGFEITTDSGVIGGIKSKRDLERHLREKHFIKLCNEVGGSVTTLKGHGVFDISSVQAQTTLIKRK